MPAINYYIPDETYARLVYLSVERGIKVKKLIDEALDLWLMGVDKATKEAQKQ